MNQLTRSAVAAALAGASLVAVPAGAAAPPVRVQANDFRFCAAAENFCSPLAASPYSITVKVGTTVQWFYNDTACDVVVPCPGHNVVFGPVPKVVKGNTLSPTPSRPVLLTKRFAKPGTYSYYCQPHQGQGMTGTVVVVK